VAPQLAAVGGVATNKVVQHQCGCSSRQRAWKLATGCTNLQPAGLGSLQLAPKRDTVLLAAEV
jgi:hypothetical protein